MSLEREQLQLLDTQAELGYNVFNQKKMAEEYSSAIFFDLLILRIYLLYIINRKANNEKFQLLYFLIFKQEVQSFFISL